MGTEMEGRELLLMRWGVGLARKEKERSDLRFESERALGEAAGLQIVSRRFSGAMKVCKPR
jgi:hypothetical protein